MGCFLREETLNWREIGTFRRLTLYAQIIDSSIHLNASSTALAVFFGGQRDQDLQQK